MRRLCIILAAALGMAGCAQEAAVPAEGEATVILAVNWQRMVTDDGETCDRCGSTQGELREAVGTLRESLRPLGITVEFVEEKLTTEECAEDIIKSNRILINDRSIEDWLGGAVGQSECGSCCEAIGEVVECRTVTVDGTTYDAVPSELIVRAGLVAASSLMQVPSPGQGCSCECGATETGSPCCPDPTPDDEGAAT